MSMTLSFGSLSVNDNDDLHINYMNADTSSIYVYAYFVHNVHTRHSHKIFINL